MCLIFLGKISMHGVAPSPYRWNWYSLYVINSFKFSSYTKRSIAESRIMCNYLIQWRYKKLLS